MEAVEHRSPRLLAAALTVPKQYLIVFLFFLLAVVGTRSPFLNDTVYYVNDIQTSTACSSLYKCPQLWDAAHLLWRPLARSLYSPLSGVLSRFTGYDSSTAICLLLVTLSGLSILISTLLVCSISVNETADIRSSLFIAAAFLGANANLYALHSGTSYPAGLACLLAAIWYVQRGCHTGRASAMVLAGVFGALSVAFWLPYIVALPVLLCWVLMAGRRTGAAKMGFILTVSAAVLGALLFTIAAQFRGIESFAGLRQWIVESGHGTQQNRNLIRSLVGLPRSFVDIGEFGLRMKQFLFKDPYASVKLGHLLWPNAGKIALFYAVLAVFLMLGRYSPDKRIITLFLIAFAMNMALAVMFEGGSMERYFPLFPFFFLAAAQCLTLSHFPRPARVLVVIFLVLMIAGNVWRSSAHSVLQEQDRAAQRVAPLLPVAQRSVFYVLPSDTILWLRGNAPFHPLIRGGVFTPQAIYQPMMRTAHWRNDFAKRVVSKWSQGEDVWVTTRVWSEQPRLEWDWVEGDDPNITWARMAGFFRPLQHESLAGGEDGFVRLLPVEANRAFLSSYIETGR